MRLLETDTLANQNIASVLAIGVYTADAARDIVVRVAADQVAGAGDYAIYATLQIGGSGSAYRLQPTTTATVASGVTAVMFHSISIAVSTGDVVTIYLDGLAGDTTTVDTRVDWYEVDTLRPTTADRTLDVSAGGEAGVDWANVGSPTTAVNLSATNIDTDQVVASVAGAVGSVTGAVGSVAAGGITAASIATGAINADALASDAVAEIWAGVTDSSGVTTLLTRITALLQTKAEADTAHGLLATAASLATVATNVSTAVTQTTAAAIRTALGLASANIDTQFGLTATAAKLLKYFQLALRKDAAIATDNATELTAINASGGSGAGAFVSTTDSQEAIRDAISAGSASAADIAAELGGMGYTVVDADSVSSSAVSKRRGDLWTVAFTDLGALGTWTKLWLTIKSGHSDADASATVQILLTNPGAGTDGLQRLNGAAATPAQGGLVVDDSASGDITATIAAIATAQLAPGLYYFDVQICRAAGTTTLAEGTWTVRGDVTRAVS